MCVVLFVVYALKDTRERCIYVVILSLAQLIHLIGRNNCFARECERETERFM